jgi:hypothetical protein
MIGYVLGATRAGATTLHRVLGSTPGWALCGTFCNTHPHVPAEATGTFCQQCVELERLEDAYDDRGSDGPYSHEADGYMRRPTPEPTP